jgi:hypothetical protein
MRWLVLLAVACGSSDRDPPHAGAVVVEGPTCKTAIANVMTLARREMRRHAPDQLAKLSDVEPAMLAHCSDDHWSPDAITCFTSARKPEDTEKCQSLLTPQQRDSLQLH